MKLDIRPRGWGKTHDAILLCAAECTARRHTYIVCVNEARVRQVERLAEQMGVNIPFPLTFREAFLRPGGLGFTKGLIIDDLDDCVAALTHLPILCATLSQEENDNADTCS